MSRESVSLVEVRSNRDTLVTLLLQAHTAPVGLLSPGRAGQCRRAAVGIAVIATVGGLAAAQGGYFPRAWGVSVLLLWAVAVGLLALPHIGWSTLEVVALAAFGALAAWTAVSTTWSADPTQSVLEVQRLVLYLAAFTALLLFARPGYVDTVLVALVVACVLVCGYGLATWLGSDPTAESGALAAPIGYSGAFGLLAAMGVLLALGLSLDAATPATRALAGAALVPPASVLVLAASRTAFLALGIGLVVAGALGTARRNLIRFTSLLSAAALAAVVLAAAGGIVSGTRSDTPHPGMSPPARALDVDHAAESLRARIRLWDVAWESARDRPLVGWGAGSYQRLWQARREAPGNARDAHNLYLETFAELGAVGLGLLLVILLAPVWAAARGRAHPLVGAAAGAYVTFLVHAGLHWDWEMPAVTIVALTCAAVLLVGARPKARSGNAPTLARAVGIAIALTISVAALAGLVGNAALARSRAAALAGAPSEAEAQALIAARWQPWSGEPWRLAGEAALAQGNIARAGTRFRRGLERDARNWRLWADLSLVADRRTRRIATRRAATLNPLGER
jgi:O-antigen ligase